MPKDTNANSSPSPLKPPVKVEPKPAETGTPPPERLVKYSWYAKYVNLPFWRTAWAMRGIPFGTSVALHAIVLGVLAIIVPPLVGRVIKNPTQEQIVVPDTMLAANNDVGGVPNPGLGQDPTRAAAQNNNSDSTDAQGWSQRESESLAQALRAAGSTDDIASGQVQANTGAGKNASALSALDQEAGGSAANFGPRGGGQIMGPKSKMFGSGGNVSSVIYVCDWSGSLVGSKDAVLISELNTVVASLAPVQAFNVLVFQEGVTDQSHFRALAKNLVMATPINKTKVFSFLNGYPPRGTTNPLPALTEAFREKPQLIFLLTDGDFDNPSGEEVLARINQLNKDKTVHVNTILLLGTRSEQYDNFETIMTKIASQNGGVYKKYYCDEFSPRT